MTNADAQTLAEDLSRQIGLRFIAAIGQNNLGQFVDFGFAELDKNEGFSVHVQLGWRSLEVSFRPGNYAAALISEMGKANHTSKSTFRTLAKLALETGGVISLVINGTNCDSEDYEKWPHEWRTLSLSLKKSPIELAEQDVLKEIRGWSIRFTSLVLALLPVEDVQVSASDELAGFPEGAKLLVEVNRYERDRRNRALCLQLRGYKCVVCGFDFKEVYGDLGQDFIHVHHVVPVSQLGANYIINPIVDLVPICPNCHAMVHKRNPPYTVEELKERIIALRSAAAVNS